MIYESRTVGILLTLSDLLLSEAAMANHSPGLLSLPGGHCYPLRSSPLWDGLLLSAHEGQDELVSSIGHLIKYVGKEKQLKILLIEKRGFFVPDSRQGDVGTDFNSAFFFSPRNIIAPANDPYPRPCPLPSRKGRILHSNALLMQNKI